MQNSIINDLKKLAHEILLLEEQNEVDSLREKAQKIYENLIVLDHINKKSLLENHTENISRENEVLPSKEKEEEIIEIKVPFNKEIIPEKEINEEQQLTLDDIFVPTFDSIKEDMSQKEEFKDTISLDETEKLFHTKKKEHGQLSLNDKLLGNNIQIGLNDRIAFVNKLFNFSQAEFNKVIGRLNQFNNKQDALNFIQYSVKPKYNWKDKEDLEERLILIIERKFL